MRVAEERGSFIGQEVGYCVRFDNCFDPKTTRVKVKICISQQILKQVVFLSQAKKDALLGKPVTISAIPSKRLKERLILLSVKSGTITEERQYNLPVYPSKNTAIYTKALHWFLLYFIKLYISRVEPTCITLAIKLYLAFS